MLISRALAFVRYFGTFLLIWVAGVLAAEGAFRLIGDTPSNDLDGLYMQFGDRSYKHRPLVTTGAKWSTGPFSVYTDKLGLRCDKDLKFGATPGENVDVLFIGDSQGFGNGVNYEQTIAGTVAQLATNRVIRNCSVGGHHAPNQFELVRWLRNEQNIKVSKYIYLLTPVGIASCDNPTRARVGEDGHLYGEGSTRPWDLARIWIKTHSVSYGRVRDAVRSQGIGVEADDKSSFVYRLYRAGAVEEQNRRKWVDFIKQFQAFAQRDHASIEFVYMPLTLEMNFDSIQKAAEKSGNSVDVEAPYRILAGAAREMNIPLHDLRPVLRELYKEGKPLSLLPDFHYTGAVSSACGRNVWEDLAPSVRTIAKQLEN